MLIAASGLSPASELKVREASLSAAGLALSIDLSPDAEVLDALAASIPLTFVVRTRGTGLAQRLPVTLSYAPLLDRYELQTPQAVHSFRLRAELLDAFESLRGLPVGTGVQQVRVTLDLAALPTPLHLPAWLSDAWNFDSGWQPVSDAALSADQEHVL